jgi:hypothetical protein
MVLRDRIFGDGMWFLFIAGRPGKRPHNAKHSHETFDRHASPRVIARQWPEPDNAPGIGSKHWNQANCRGLSLQIDHVRSSGRARSFEEHEVYARADGEKHAKCQVRLQRRDLSPCKPLAEYHTVSLTAVNSPTAIFFFTTA